MCYIAATYAICSVNGIPGNLHLITTRVKATQSTRQAVYIQDREKYRNRTIKTPNTKIYYFFTQNRFDQGGTIH